MDAKKMFRVVVFSGAALVVNTLGCGPEKTTNPVTNADGGDDTDAGACECHQDPVWPGMDCAPAGQTSVCCWLQPSAACCS